MNARLALQQFGTPAPFPLAALRWANNNRDQVIPLLTTEIEQWLIQPRADRRLVNRVFFAFHLLGIWRHKPAYRLLGRLLRSTPAQITRVLGDCETETSHRVIAAVFDGDPQPVFDIILDPTASEFVRFRMIETVAMLVSRRELPRDRAAAFLRQCWDELQPRHDCFVWNGWQSAIAMIGLAELKPLVLRAFLCGAIDREWVSVSEFQHDLAYTVSHAGVLPPHRWSEYAGFGEPVSELERICNSVRTIHLPAGAEPEQQRRRPALPNRRSSKASV